MEVPNVHPFYSPDMEPLLWALHTASSVPLDKPHCCVCLEHRLNSHQCWDTKGSSSKNSPHSLSLLLFLPNIFPKR